ncbi:hypothetical protein GO285_05304 [Ralstonia solanacearum]|nr:hypothetical protein [Ralstonia solanacearum]NKG13470.1 hypothetical protein [Ralstonia solanacearum]
MRRHGPAVCRANQSLEQRRTFSTDLAAAHAGGLAGQRRLHGIPLLLRHDRLVLAGVADPLVPDLAQVDRIVQDLVQRALVHQLAHAVVAGLRDPRLGHHAFVTQPLHEQCRGRGARKLGEQAAHHRRLHLVDHQLTVEHVIAQWRHAAHPHALALARRDLVADALARHLALELREGQQHVQHQPPHRRGRIELLGDRHEGHVLAFEHLDHLREVRQAAGQPVDLVDHNDVDQAALDVRQQTLQARPLHVAAGVRGIVVVVRHRNPALGTLTGDVGVTRVTLCIDRVEVLIEPFVRGLAGVDRATPALPARF